MSKQDEGSKPGRGKRAAAMPLIVVDKPKRAYNRRALPQANAAIAAVLADAAVEAPLLATIPAKTAAPAPAAPASQIEAKSDSAPSVQAEPIPEPVVETVAETVAAPAADELEVATPSPAPSDDSVQPSAVAPVGGEPIQKGFKMATNFNTAAFGGERMQAMFGDMNDRAKTAMEKSAKIAEDMTEFTKGNVEAIVASGRVAAKGCEAISQDMAETARKQLESATTTMKSFASVKSPTELFQLQSDFARSYFDTMVAETSKLSESMLKLAGEVAQPISSRFAVAAEKMKTPAL